MLARAMGDDGVTVDVEDIAVDEGGNADMGKTLCVMGQRAAECDVVHGAS